MPGIVPPLIVCGALTQLVPPQTRAALGAMLDDRGAVAQAAFGFAILYVVIAMAPLRPPRSSTSSFSAAMQRDDAWKPRLTNPPPVRPLSLRLVRRAPRRETRSR